jgi:UDP-N-acetylglucosamine 2-epimerase
MKILCVVGARPNFMKMAPVIEEIKRRTHHAILVHTGQHYDEEMSSVFFEELGLPAPDEYLGVGSGTHAVQTGRIMAEIEKVITREAPDLTLVVGDVNSTLAASIASIKLHIPVAHVEAGYRSFDMRMPEEINRILTDRISSFLFTPTEDCVLNLINEGIPKSGIFFVGNTMAETLLKTLPKIKKRDILTRLDISEKKYTIATVHRSENTDIRGNLKSLAEAFIEADTTIVFPLHPRTRRRLEEFGLLQKFESTHVKVIDPLGYLDFITLFSHARNIVTDSGGAQEEALILGIPCITVRKTTERTITLQSGMNVLVGTKKERIVEEIKKEREGRGIRPLYWDTHVSERIVSRIEENEGLLAIKDSNVDFL